MNLSLEKCVDEACEKGASFWLSVFHIQKHGYTEAWLRFIQTSIILLMQFVSVMGRDQLTFPLTVFAENCLLLKMLQILSGELLSHHASDSDDHARLDISARSF